MATMTAEVFQGRWGFYPTDYVTFLKLKHLSKVAQRAIRQRAAWIRWERKDPHNRVVRAKIRNATGETVGYQPPTPMPEPGTDNPFLRKQVLKTNFDRSGAWVKGVAERPVVEFVGDWVLKEYRNARYPQADAKAVKKIGVSLEEIERLYNLAK